MPTLKARWKLCSPNSAEPVLALTMLLPLFPLDLVLFPETPLRLHIFEPRYKEMIGESLREKTPFGILRSNGHKVAQAGCTAEVVDMLRTYPDGRIDILTIGRRRFKVLEVNDERSFFRGRVEYFTDESGAPAGGSLAKTALAMHNELARLASMNAAMAEEDHLLSFMLTAQLPVDLDFKQMVLEMRSEQERLQVLLDYYAKIIPKLKEISRSKNKAGGNGWVH
jgi:Lon protease-like protein